MKPTPKRAFRGRTVPVSSETLLVIRLSGRDYTVIAYPNLQNSGGLQGAGWQIPRHIHSFLAWLAIWPEIRHDGAWLRMWMVGLESRAG